MIGLPTRFDTAVVVQRGDDASGHRDPTTGFWVVDDEASVVYTGMVNLQAGGLIMASRRATSTAFADADGVMCAPRRDAARIMDLMPGDRCHFSYPRLRRGSAIVSFAADAEVVFVRPEDRAAVLRYR